MNSGDSSCSSSNEQGKKRLAKKKQHYVQNYNANWGLDHKFKFWVERSPKGNNWFRCKICNDDYTTVGGKSNLTKHQRSEKHTTQAKAVAMNRPISDCLKKTNQLSQQVKEAEIRMAAFIAEHNLAFNIMDHLVPLIQTIGTDPEVIKNLSCGRTKCTQIIKNVTGVSGFEILLQHLRREKFSIIVDESTDMSSVKHLVIIARYFDGKSVTDQFLGLIPVADAKARSLHSCLVNFFAENQIPYI